MDDNNSSPSTSTADRLNSFHPECNNLKQQYDQCFNAWFTDHYMNGHYNNVECQKLFEIYTDCVKVIISTSAMTYLKCNCNYIITHVNVSISAV